MNRLQLLALVPAAFVLLLSPSVSGQESPSAEDVKKLTSQAIEEYVTAYNAHDATAVAAQYAPDGELVRIRGDQVQRTSGREKIQELYAQAFSRPPNLKAKLTSESARMVSHDVYVGDGSWEVTSSVKEGSTKGRFTVVRKKIDGRWQNVCGYFFATQSLVTE